ncbi:MAG: GtrA family protein [Candidatus Sulfotelmatobacter sp.]
MSRPRYLRLAKFSLVGGIGVVVQLVALAALLAMQLNYLIATALAVECAVLHNFLWHQRFTWSDRAYGTTRDSIAALFRFHLSNGLISLLGNLLLMRLLVGRVSLPVVPANFAVISACFVANFLASDRWVFLASSAQDSARGQADKTSSAENCSLH